MSDMSKHPTVAKRAVLYRMVTPEHVCPWGLKAKDLLRRRGFEVEDHHLKTREETEAFKAQHHVSTTPQTFIEGRRIGGYEDLRRYFGKRVVDPKATSYRPVIVLFTMTALAALAASYAVSGHLLTSRALQWFIAFSMVVLSLLKLQNVETFSAMFLNYDLLARRWVPYSYVYPYAEGLAGVLMIAGALKWVSVPVALCMQLRPCKKSSPKPEWCAPCADASMIEGQLPRDKTWPIDATAHRAFWRRRASARRIASPAPRRPPARFGSDTGPRQS